MMLDLLKGECHKVLVYFLSKNHNWATESQCVKHCNSAKVLNFIKLLNISESEVPIKLWSFAYQTHRSNVVKAYFTL